MSRLRRTAALLEVFGVYLAGQFVVTLLTGMFSLKVVNPLTGFTAAITDAELITATGQLFVLLVMQYIGWFLLIIPINWLYRRRGLAGYGLTKAGQSWTTLVLAGVATVAMISFIAWPAAAVLLADSIYHLHLGETVPWRQAFFDTSWRRWEFWLFSATVSWAFIPVVEELFFRGYCQRRLAEDWGEGPAIIGSALLFVFAHSQYSVISAYNLSLVATLLMLAIGFGVVFAWTRSLIPSMVGHAIINFPMTPPWQALIVTAFAIGGVVMRRRGFAALKQVFSSASVAVLRPV